VIPGVTNAIPSTSLDTFPADETNLTSYTYLPGVKSTVFPLVMAIATVPVLPVMVTENGVDEEAPECFFRIEEAVNPARLLVVPLASVDWKVSSKSKPCDITILSTGFDIFRF
jgi:hypothetical protein